MKIKNGAHGKNKTQAIAGYKRIEKVLLLRTASGRKVLDRKTTVHLYCQKYGIEKPSNKNRDQFVYNEYHREGSPIFKGIKLAVVPSSKKRREKWKNDRYDRKRKYKEYINSSKWKSFRISIIKQRGNRCEKCGSESGPIEAHHLTYERIFNENPSDIMLLCRMCHKKIHGKI